MSPGAARRAAVPPAPRADLYLLPAVVGGGLGDIEEVLLAGRRLARVGFRPRLYRPADRPEVRSLDGPWGFPRLERSHELRPRYPRAVTLSAWWGVSAGPGRDEPFGRPGSWSEETSAIERAYCADRVLHVSFEEFARTLTSRAQTIERWREGGRPLREIRARVGRPATLEEERAFREAFERFRAADRPNVLHLYPTFVRSRSFAREFPWAVQTGPFWPEPVRPAPRRARGIWIWYASPASSAALARTIAAGWAPTGRPITIRVRAPKEFPLPPAPGLTWERLPAMAPDAWRRAWAAAELRLATGSRTFLEALVDGGPFLYFNGVTGTGSTARRHRPEKILSLLQLWRGAEVSARVRRDLADFSRGRAVGRILRSAREDATFARRFPRAVGPRGFAAAYRDGGAFVERAALAFADGRTTAPKLVAALRRGATRLLDGNGPGH